MATYGGNSIIMDSSYASSGNISSSNGVISGGQVIYTNTDNYYKVFRVVGFYAVTINTAANVSFSLQRQGVNNSNWFGLGTVSASGGEIAGGTEGKLTTQTFLDPLGVPYSVPIFQGCSDYTYSAQFIMPINSRIVVAGGSNADGATIRITYDVFKFYNS